ncbi:hypothetical protein M513_14017, partial [Trichuris suis]
MACTEEGHPLSVATMAYMQEVHSTRISCEAYRIWHKTYGGQDLIVCPQEASPCACFGCRGEEEFKRFSGATLNFSNHEYSVSQVDKSSVPRPCKQHEQASSETNSQHDNKVGSTSAMDGLHTQDFEEAAI